MAHFYLSDELGDPEAGDLVAISGAEARHAVAVSRVRVGERLTIGDGVGRIVRGSVASAAPDRLELIVDAVTNVPAPTPAIRLAQALAKGGRDESAVQAATELGVDAVIPWAASRSVVRWDGPRAEKGRQRWESIAREATKQSMRAWLPPVIGLVSSVELARSPGRLLVLSPGADAAISSIGTEDARDITLIVGPEGGIAPDELELLVAAGATPVRLGDEVLRTSTAGPAALAVLNVTLGRWM